MPSSLPATPPKPYDFILYTLTTSKMLVESTSSVFSRVVFICVCEDEKPFKWPIGYRVKHQMTLNFDITDTFGSMERPMNQMYH